MVETTDLRARRSIAPLVLMVSALVIVNALFFSVSWLAIGRINWAYQVFTGFLQAQAGLYCILAGSVGRAWIASFLQVAILSIVAALSIYLPLAAYTQIAVLDMFLMACGVVPPILFCACLPFFLLRGMFGWHLSHRMDVVRDDYSLRMEDLFLATAVVASMTVIGPRALGIVMVDDSENIAGILLSISVMCLMASTVAVVPVTILYFRAPSRLSRTWVLIGFALLGWLATVATIAAMELWSSASMATALLSSLHLMAQFVPASIMFSCGLIVMHASGYRWAKIHRVTQDSNSPTADVFADLPTQTISVSSYRRRNRFATCFLVLGVVAQIIFIEITNAKRAAQAATFKQLNLAYQRDGGYVQNDRHLLQSLKVPSTATDETLMDLGKHRELQNLSLAGSQVTDRALENIAQMGSLVSIDVSDTAISDIGAKYLAKLRSAHTISLAGTRVTSAGIKEILSKNSFNSLDLSRLKLDDAAISELLTQKCRRLMLSGNSITDASIPKLEYAERLDLSHTQIQGVGFDKLTRVERLKLDGTAVNDEAIAKLLKNNLVIRHLSLRDTQVTIATLKALCTTKVTQLQLGDGQISPEDVVASGFVPTEYLALNSKKFDGSMFAQWQPAIEHLDMSDSGVVDANINLLSNVGSLKKLSLAGCDISEKSLEALSSLGLLEIDLTDTHITAEAARRYFEKRDDIKIYLSVKQCTEDELLRQTKSAEFAGFSRVSETIPQLRIGYRLKPPEE